MCKSFNINYDILTERNHKGLRVEKFYRFINKAITIVVEDRGTSDIFVAAGVTAGYAWNSSPIDGTDILRSVPAIGRELHFPLDIETSALPPPPPLCQIMQIQSFLTCDSLIPIVTFPLLSSKLLSKIDKLLTPKG